MIPKIPINKPRMLISEDTTDFIVECYNEDCIVDVFMRLPKSKYSLYEVLVITTKL